MMTNDLMMTNDTVQQQKVTVHHAGAIVSQDGTKPQAIAVAGDTIRASGTREDLRSRFPDAEIVVHDGVILPGFNDAHTHLAHTAESELGLDVSASSAPTKDVLLEAVRARADGGSGWVMAGNYDDTRTGPLSRTDLDAVAPSVPVIVRQVSAHWAVLNSAALEALGIDESTPEPAGGRHGRDSSGRLDGHLYERALLDRYLPDNGLTAIPSPDTDDVVDSYMRTVMRWNAAGITSACDALVGRREMPMHMAARTRGQSALRVNMLIAAEIYEDYRSLGFDTDFGDEFLRVAGVKAFVDGAVGGRTCLVSEPFDGTDDHGMQITTDEALAHLVDRVNADGNRIAVHANGDDAIRLLLNSLEQAHDRTPSRVRHRIEHCSIVDDDIVARIAALGLTVVPLAAYPRLHGGTINRVYGADRAERMFANRSFLDAGIVVAASTDHPVGPFEPLAAIQSMVTRTGLDGELVGPSQAITVDEAIAIYTIGSATATGEDHRKGRLTPGFLADFVVLGEDPRTIDPAGIADIPVLATYTGGSQVFDAATGR